jgi:hypothetical protein
MPSFFRDQSSLAFLSVAALKNANLKAVGAVHQSYSAPEMVPVASNYGMGFNKASVLLCMFATGLDEHYAMEVRQHSSGSG